MTAAVPGPLSLVPFVSVDHMMQIVSDIGIERVLSELASYIEEDFRRWGAVRQNTPNCRSLS